MRKVLLLLLIFSAVTAYGQEKYYSAPVKIPMLLSGSFAELRSNHFHSGIDIKTQGTTGIPIFSVAEGFISRIVVSPGGYGKALYISHPNGTTSVYGHLSSFRKDITEYVKNIQYKKQSFKVDIPVLPGTFPVKKDEQIAKSGNSGSSGGPHLHFEVRDTQSEEPMNPLKFDFGISDHTPPKVLSLMMVPLSDTSHIKFETRKRRFPIVYYDGKYHIKGNPNVPVYGKIGFAIETNDYFDNSWNRCGIYSLQLTIDDELYFAHKLDQFSFDESRYINSHIDYESYIQLKRRFQKTWIEAGNKLSTYEYVKEDGSFEAGDSKLHKVRIELKDTHKNTSTLEFNIESKPFTIEKEQSNFIETFSHKHINKFESEEIELNLSKDALYSDIKFEYKTLPQAPGYFSPIHVIHKNTVPLHKPAEIKIKAINVPEELQRKALLVIIDDKTANHWPSGGNYDNGWVHSTIRTFGHYAIKVDTIPPTIKALSIATNSTLTEGNRLRFKISDDLSGIDKIEGILDGKWALFDYDAKNGLITHYFDKSRFDFNKKHQFNLTVSDYKGNQNNYEATFWK